MKQQQHQNILCTSILHQGKMMAILYLENHLTTGAFTRDRVAILNILYSQVAIFLQNTRLYQQSQEYAQKLELDLNNSQQIQLQLVQSKKMSVLGNLMAGVAHEINNPVCFIVASLSQAKPTVAELIEHLKLYQANLPNLTHQILDYASEIVLNSTLEDLPKVINSMDMACEQLKNISTSLRTFSCANKNYKIPFNIYKGINKIILIIKHRLKANEQCPAI